MESPKTKTRRRKCLHRAKSYDPDPATVTTKGAAAGNVMVQALARGRVRSLAAIRAVIRQSTALKRYDPASTGVWDDAYARFGRLLR